MEPGASSGRLLLLRHGQGSLGTDDYDRLSPLGREQAERLGQRLRRDYDANWPTWCGSLKRHRQTVAGMKQGEPDCIDASLDEYRVDQLIGSAVAQAESLGLRVPGEDAFADPAAYLMTFLEWFPEVLSVWQNGRLICEGNGDWSGFRKRVLSPLSHWQEELAAGRSLVVVSSAGVISTMTAELLGHDLAWQRDLNIRLYNASLTELALDAQGRWQAVRINCVDHLDDPRITLA